MHITSMINTLVKDISRLDMDHSNTVDEDFLKALDEYKNNHG